MAEIKDITRDLDKLDSQLDDLEETLAPLLGNIDEISSQMPLLDKAKLFSLAAFSIESLLFCTDAQGHAVYTELKRVQQYFGKIKAIEEPAGARSTTVNKEAAARILKANLGDNKALSNRLAEKIAEERARALLKSVEDRKRPADDGAIGAADGSRGVKKAKHKNKGKNKKRRG